MALITADEAKKYLRILNDQFDDELALKVPQGSAIVLDYITIAEADLDANQLEVARAAAFEVTRNLFESADPLSPDIKNALRRLRDPSLA